MKFETKYFGTVEVPPDEVITFPNGLFGFEEERSFLLLPFAGSDGNMLCLQSAATPSLAFIAMNPFSLHPSYQPLLSSEELREMEVKDSHALCWNRMPTTCGIVWRSSRGERRAPYADSRPKSG